MFYILITYLPDIVLILQGDTLSWSLAGSRVKEKWEMLCLPIHSQTFFLKVMTVITISYQGVT